MADLVPGQPSTLGLGFGHAATLTRSKSDTVVVIRGPDGAAAVEIRVTEAGAVVKAKAASSQDEAPVDVPSRLSLRQYASFRAECVGAPEKAPAIRSRYGLSESDEMSETGTWSRMFGSDPGLFDLYKRLFQQFRTAPDRAGLPPASALLSVVGPRLGPPASPSPSAPSVASHAVAAPPPAAGHRTLTLEQHATFSAEVFASADRDAVYRKYGLEDESVRAEVLRRCEARLDDEAHLETWKRVYALELRRIQSPRR